MKRRVSLRLLFLLVTAVAIGLGVIRYYVVLFHNQDEAFKKLVAEQREPLTEPMFPGLGWTQIEGFYKVVECDLSRDDGTLIEEVLHFPFLRKLDVSHSGMTDDQAQRILPRCSRLEILNLVGSKISRESASSISRLSSLRALRVSYADENADSLPRLLKSPRLRYLYCPFPLRAKELKLIGRHPKVEFGRMNCESIQAVDLEQLSDRNTAGTLRLSRCDIDEGWGALVGKVKFYKTEIHNSKIAAGFLNTYRLPGKTMVLDESLSFEDFFDSLECSEHLVFRQRAMDDKLVASASSPNGLEGDVWVRNSKLNRGNKLQSVRAKSVMIWNSEWMDVIESDMLSAAAFVDLTISDPKHLEMIRGCQKSRELKVVVNRPMTPVAFDPVPELLGLESLELSVHPSSGLPMDWVCRNRSLRSLNLSADMLAMAKLKRLRELPSLETVELIAGNEWPNDSELVELIRSFPKIRKVTVHWELEDFSSVQELFPNVNLGCFDD